MIKGNGLINISLFIPIMLFAYFVEYPNLIIWIYDSKLLI